MLHSPRFSHVQRPEHFTEALTCNESLSQSGQVIFINTNLIQINALTFCHFSNYLSGNLRNRFLPTTSELMQFFSSDFSYLVENETEEGGQCHVNTALSLLSLSLSLPHLPPSLYKKKK